MDCPICLDAFADQTVVCTPCGHLFHRECIEQHIRAQIRPSVPCPTCRSTFIPDDRILAQLPYHYRTFWQPGLRKVFLGSQSASQHATDDFRARFQALENKYKDSQVEVQRCKSAYASAQAYNTRLSASLQAVAVERDEAVREKTQYQNGYVAVGVQLQQECAAHHSTQLELQAARAELAQRQHNGRAAVDRLGALLGQWHETRLTGVPPADDHASGLQAALSTERELHGATKQTLEQRARASAAKEAELRARLEELERCVVEKDRVIAAKESQLTEKGEELIAKDGQLASKNGELAAKDRQLAEKENQLAVKDKQVAEKIKEVTSTSGLIKEREQQLEELYRQLKRKEIQLKAKDGELLQVKTLHLQDGQQFNSELRSKDGQLWHQETEIVSMRRQLASKDKLLSEKDQRIVDLMAELAMMKENPRLESQCSPDNAPSTVHALSRCTAQPSNVRANSPVEPTRGYAATPLSPPTTPRASPAAAANSLTSNSNAPQQQLPTPTSTPKKVHAAKPLPRVLVSTNRLPKAPVATVVSPCEKASSGGHCWRTTGSNQYIRKYRCQSCAVFVEERKSSGSDPYWARC